MKNKKPKVPTINVFVYCVSFEPDMKGYYTTIFTLPRPIDKTADLRKIEELLNSGRQDSGLAIVGRKPFRITGVSFLHEAQIEGMVVPPQIPVPGQVPPVPEVPKES